MKKNICLKKIFTLPLKLIIIFLSILILSMNSTIENAFDLGTHSWVLFPFSIILTTAMTYLIFSKFYRSNLLWKRVGLHIVSVFAFSIILIGSSWLLDKSRGIDKYNYQAGFAFNDGGVLFKNSVGQLILQSIYYSFGSSTEEILRAAEESSKTFLIHNEFKASFPYAPDFCQSKELTDCFIELYRRINVSTNSSSTFHILMISSGADLFFKYKKKSIEKDKAKIPLSIIKIIIISLEGILKDWKIRLKSSPLADLESRELMKVLSEVNLKYLKSTEKRSSKIMKKVRESESCKELCLRQVSLYSEKLQVLETNLRKQLLSFQEKVK